MLLPFDDLQQKVLKVLSAMKTCTIIEKQAFLAYGSSQPVVHDDTRTCSSRAS